MSPNGRTCLGVVLPLVLAFFLLAAGTSAHAASPLKVREVFPGSVAHGADAEFVELQMTADGQGDIDGQVVQFYEADGALASIYAIGDDSLIVGQSQRTVLLATQEAVEDFPSLPAPDFNLGSGADRMDPSGGAVCFAEAGGAPPADCVT